MGKRKRGKKGGKAPKTVDPAIKAEVEALEEAQDVASLVELTAAGEAKDGGKVRRDLARKALHRLRQSGVEVPDARGGAGGSQAARLRLIAAEAEDVPISRVTAPDGTGTLVVWLVRSGGQAGGLRVAQVVVSETDGVDEIAIHRLTRSEWRRMWESMDAERDVIVGDLPAWEVAAWLRPALEGDPDKREARQKVTELRELVAALPDRGGPPHVYSVLDEDPDEGPADGGVDLLAIRPVSTWIPDVGAMEELLADLEEAEDSPLELTDQQKAERREGLIDKHVDAWATAAVRGRLRARLEQTARVMASRGDKETARRLLSGGRAMNKADRSSATPWLRELMAKWLAPASSSDDESLLDALNPAESLDQSGSDQ